MTAFIYEWLNKLGYSHNLHPAVVHFPIGVAMVSAIALFIAHKFNKPAFATTAYHCQQFGLVAMPIVMFIGYMDWQQFYGGSHNPHIALKILLAFFLTAAFSASAIVGRKGQQMGRKFKWTTSGALIIALSIGYLGGELLYGG
jgi:uncharacterized membrane protein